MRNVSLAKYLAVSALFVASAGALSAQTPLTTVLFKNGFTNPIYLTAPPNDFDRVFVVERAGKIKVVKNIQTSPMTNATPFLDITGLTTTVGERGLLSMAFHPNYASNGKFFIYYTNSSGNIVVAQYSVSANPDVANSTATILLTIPHPSFSNHNGGTVLFGPDGYLYFACGDGGSANDPNNNAQNINSFLGKMHRIDVDNPAPHLAYGIPPNNPYAGATPGLDEIWAQGHRNPFRFSFDRNTGDLYVGDVGQNLWEEVDFQPAGSVPPTGSAFNYGWRCLEGTHPTNLAGCQYPNPYPNEIAPIYEYGHAGSINCVIGGVVYRGTAVPDLRGTYFFGDNGSSNIWSFIYTNGNVTNFKDRTAELAPGGGLSIASICAFCQDAMGEVYICDLNGGEIFKIVPVNPVLVGVSSFGTGTPGCNGAQLLTTNTSPVINNPGFEVFTSNSPSGALGLGLATNVADVAGSDPFGIGVLLHVDLFLSTSINTFDVNGNAMGVGVAAVPIPNAPPIVGSHFYLQTISAWTTCSLPPFNLSSSDGLDLTIQP
jgi:glucose/arabinose dehydrogenase